MLRVAAADEDHAVGTTDRAMVTIWRRETRGSAVLELHEILGELLNRSPGKAAMLTIVEADATLPNAATRAQLAEVLKRPADRIACSALVYEGEGFRAAAIRAITTTIGTLAGTPYPHRAFRSIKDATDWMERRDAGLNGARLRDGADALRETLNQVPDT